MSTYLEKIRLLPLPRPALPGGLKAELQKAYKLTLAHSKK